MKVSEQTSTQLILQDSSERIWIFQLLTAIFLIWGIGDVLMVIVDRSFFSLIIAIHIIFLLGVGTALAFFACKNTVYFDKTHQKLIMIQESPLKKNN